LAWRVLNFGKLANGDAMFRFTIRDVLWLTVVVGMGLGWWSWWQSLPPQNQTVSGAISLNGKPLSDGVACFRSQDGQIFGAKVSNGNYRVKSIPVGNFTVSIEGADVPSRYSGDKTELRVSVNDGVNEINFDLRSR